VAAIWVNTASAPGNHWDQNLPTPQGDGVALFPSD